MNLGGSGGLGSGGLGGSGGGIGQTTRLIAAEAVVSASSMRSTGRTLIAPQNREEAVNPESWLATDYRAYSS